MDVTDNPGSADGIILNAENLGRKALAAFNQLAEDEATQSLGVILLLDEAQYDWEARASLGPRRVVLKMPLKLKDLRESLAVILPVQ